MIRKIKFLNVVIIIIFFVPIAFLASEFIGGGFNPTTIHEYNAEITINESGDMRVVETWDMTYEEALRVRFRDIDYIKYPEYYPLYESPLNGALFDTDDVVVTVLKDGEDITDSIRISYSFDEEYDETGSLITCEPYRWFCESIFTDLEDAGGLEGNITFIYEYTIEGVITQYSDISELNWVLFDYAENGVDKGSITITLPENTNQLSNYYVFSHDIDNTTTQIISNDTIKISFEDMSIDDILGFRLLVPTNIFPNISGGNKVISSEINKQVILDFEQSLEDHAALGEKIESVFVYIAIGVAIFLAASAYGVYKKFFTKFKTNFNETMYRQLPSNHSPAEVGYLYRYKKIKDEDVTATILDLVRREYLSLDDSLAYESPSDYPLIIKRYKTKNIDLKAHESHLINWLINVIGNGTKVTTKEIEDYGSNTKEARSFQAKLQRFRYLVEKVSLKNDFFDKSLTKHKTISYAFSLVPILLFLTSMVLVTQFDIYLIVSFIVSIVGTISYQIFVATRKRRSENGQELFKKWKAYNNYLLESEELKTYNMSSIDYWEHNLVYATTFGYADKVMDQLHVKMPMTTEMARESKYLGVGYGHSSYRYGYSMHTIRHSYLNANKNSVKSISSISSSSGRSSGFSGGGSFGGGGGGGRSR